MGPNVEYATDERLTKLLLSVKRPGDFCTHGRLFLPMPTLAVEGVGLLSFPVADAQVQALIRAADRAPYGKGEQTLMDKSVRDCWQIDASRLRIGGHAWADTFTTILNAAAAGLGCRSDDLDTRLYKLLIYPTGGFFAPHRDTEKVDGMVATLTISLPTAGAGGELAVRHRDREVVIDMNAAEPSELAYAAFYADCLHETRPVRAGHRLSLVYNLCVLPGNTDAHRQAPDYAAEVEAVADHLIAWRDNGVADKLVWVLQHDYSTAGLSFTTLKNADNAVARVLDAAAVRADCSLHAAIVHIEEEGDATYRGGDHVESWHWRESDVDDMVIDELYASRHWLDGWIGSDGTRPPFAEIPLLAQELLPAHALDDAEPDERRLHEASGNEGVSLERSYRRAAVVIWPRSRTLDVIASAGIDGAIEWVAAQFATDGTTSPDHVFALAKRLVRIWSHDPYGREEDATRSRVRMLDLLAQVGNRDLTLLFLREVALSHYSGGENQSLLAALAAVGPETSRQYLPDFLDAHFVRLPDQTLALLRKVEEAAKIASRSTLAACVRQAVRALPEVLGVKRRPFEWSQSEPRMMIGVSGVRDLMALAWRCGLTEDALTAASLAAEHAQVLSPERAIPAVLDELRSEAGLTDTAAYAALWRHAVASLLVRSATPPEPPADWTIAVNVDCPCELCTKLREFCADPVARTERFPVRADLRQHLHHMIDAHRLDMFHETERRGRPYTLVCTKNRASHERRIAEYAEDVARMRSLAKAKPGGQSSDPFAAQVARLHNAVLAGGG